MRVIIYCSIYNTCGIIFLRFIKCLGLHLRRKVYLKSNFKYQEFTMMVGEAVYDACKHHKVCTTGGNNFLFMNCDLILVSFVIFILLIGLQIILWLVSDNFFLQLTYAILARTTCQNNARIKQYVTCSLNAWMGYSTRYNRMVHKNMELLQSSKCCKCFVLIR